LEVGVLTTIFDFLLILKKSKLTFRGLINSKNKQDQNQTAKKRQSNL
jgi:hypothetical protein